MDPITDLPPMTTSAVDHFTSPSPPVTTNLTHPPYAEMITAAITALKDKDGSSRQAISKYIEKEFANLPPTHSTLLTHHLKRLKNLGQLIMNKHSYMLPSRSVQFQLPGSSTAGYQPALDHFSEENVPNDSGVGLENLASGSLKRRGRPPKLKPVPGLGGVQTQMPNVQPYNAAADVSSYQPQFQYHGHGVAQDVGDNYGSGSDFQGNSAGGSEPLFASLGLGDDGVVVPPPVEAENPNTNTNTNTPVVAAKRGRGRPPKSAGASGGQVQALVAGSASDGGGEIQGVEEASGRQVRKVNGLRVKRGRGRPRRVGFGAVTVPLSGNLLRPRGRPKRMVRPKVAVNGAAGEGVLGSSSTRRGRPSRISRNVITDQSGKPYGSLSTSGPGTAVLVTDPQQLVVYRELESKYKHLQSKVKQVASVVKSCIDPEYGNNALGALQELEDLAAEVNTSQHGQTSELALSASHLGHSAPL